MRKRIVLYALIAGCLLAVPAALPAGETDWKEEGLFAVDFAYEPEKPQIGRPVTFIAIFKGTPAPGTLVTWRLSEKVYLEGNPIQYIFEGEGPQPVEVEVIQPNGKILNEAKVVVIEPLEPDPKRRPTPYGAQDVSFEWSSEKPVAGEPITFVAIFKGTPTDDAVLTWEFPRGEKRHGNPVRYTFGTPRKWLVTVTLEPGGFKPLQFSAYVPVGPGKVAGRGR
jgi:hypothetical protein